MDHGATLKPGFQIRSPQTPFTGTVGEFLDAPVDSDRLEAKRIVKSIDALHRHNQRTQNSATDLVSPQSIGNQQECRRLSAHTTKSTPVHSWKLPTGCVCSTKKKLNG